MCRVYLSPCLNYGENFGGSEICECLVVRRRESEDVAFSCHWIGAEEQVGKVCCCQKSC